MVALWYDGGVHWYPVGFVRAREEALSNALSAQTRDLCARARRYEILHIQHKDISLEAIVVSNGDVEAARAFNQRMEAEFDAEVRVQLIQDAIEYEINDARVDREMRLARSKLPALLPVGGPHAHEGPLPDQSAGQGDDVMDCAEAMKVDPEAIENQEHCTVKFPKRAVWLGEALLARGWSSLDPYLFGGPDRKTVNKILNGEKVTNSVLKKLADALSKAEGLSGVDVLDIPKD